MGQQSLDVVKFLNIPVAALAAGSNVERMALQCRTFRPKLAVMATENLAMQLRDAVPELDMEYAWGDEGLIRAATMPQADCVLTAVVGVMGLRPTLAAIRMGKRIALANKETMVCAGQLVMAEAQKWGAEIVPVDSEHSAIFQCLMGSHDKRELKKLLLTCSGGPFFGMKADSLRKVTRADALKHPNWKMGPKITVDCATLMNKGLEVIEAMRLFDTDVDQVEVLIHRQSIVHSMVEFADGAVMAQMAVPDMRQPIQLAFTYPERLPGVVAPLDLVRSGPLTFQEPDLEAFPCLRLAKECAKAGGTACAVLNGANEAAVQLFLQDEIGFMDIYHRVSRAVEAVPFIANPSLEEILEVDRLARLAVVND